MEGGICNPPTLTQSLLTFIEFPLDFLCALLSNIHKMTYIPPTPHNISYYFILWCGSDDLSFNRWFMSAPAMASSAPGNGDTWGHGTE